MKAIKVKTDPTLKGIKFESQYKLVDAPIYYRKHQAGWVVLYPWTAHKADWDGGLLEKYFDPITCDNTWNSARQFAHEQAKIWEGKAMEEQL